MHVTKKDDGYIELRPKLYPATRWKEAELICYFMEDRSFEFSHSLTGLQWTYNPNNILASNSQVQSADDFLA